MTKFFALALASASLLAMPVVAPAQTTVDNNRLQQAHDRFEREFSIFRAETQRRQINQRGRETPRYTSARDRFDRELANYRTELDRYQGMTGSRYATNSGYDNNNNYNYNNANNNNYNNGNTTNSANYDDPNYDPSRDYRDGQYQERVLANNDRVYRGTDGQYYCKRNDGTTGLIIGGLGGGVLGNIIGGGGNRTVGSILGAIGGAIAGRVVERSQTPSEIRCR